MKHTQTAAASLVEYPTIGAKHVTLEVSSREGEFATLWRDWEPKIRRTAQKYALHGVIGADLEDLVAIGQTVLLHSLRTHDPKRGAFSTHTYTLLNNHFAQVMRMYPRDRVIVVGVNPNTGEREVVPTTKGMVDAERTNFRARGFTRVTVESKQRRSRRAAPHDVESIDGLPIDQSTDTDKPSRGGGHRALTTYDSPGLRGVFQILETAIPETRLRRIAVWLYVGHPVGGPKGLKRKFGLNNLQFQRDMARLRMLLKGHFDVEFEP